MDTLESLEQIKSRYDALVQRQELEKRDLSETEKNLKELRRQYYWLQFQHNEIEYLFNESIVNIDNHQIRSMSDVHETNQLLANFSSNGEAVLSDYSKLRRNIWEMEQQNFERFRELPNSFSKSVIATQLMTVENEIEQISAEIADQASATRNLKEKYNQWKVDSKILSTNMSSFITSLKKDERPSVFENPTENNPSNSVFLPSPNHEFQRQHQIQVEEKTQTFLKSLTMDGRKRRIDVP